MPSLTQVLETEWRELTATLGDQLPVPAILLRLLPDGTVEAVSIAGSGTAQHFQGTIAQCRVAQHPAATQQFSYMSTIKPLLLARVLELHGQQQVAEWVDCRSSALPYYSVEQLRADQCKPRSAMLNSGAMLLSTKLPGQTPAEHEALFVQWLSTQAPGMATPELNVSEHNACLRSESRGSNGTLARLLVQSGAIHCASTMLDTYFRLCCLQTTALDLALLAASIERSPWRADLVCAMARCGLYEASRSWEKRGLPPAKSGVSGAVFSLNPSRTVHVAYHDLLDASGNPWLPLQALSQIAD